MDNGTVYKCVTCNKPFTSREPRELPVCRECMTLVAEKRVCRTCGNPFTINVGEKAWYHNKGLALPARCYKCRQNRRNAEK